MPAKVSVVMNSYRDRSEQLRQAIRSYLRQRSVRVQLIVSTVAGDNAIRIAEKFDVRVIVNKQAGIYNQLNAALPAVTGDWYTYASGNDVALPTKLRDEVALCTGRKRICYSAFYLADKCLTVTDPVTFPKYDYRTHLKGNFISDCALMSRSILDKYGPFDVTCKNLAYWDFWLRVAEGEGDVFVYNRKPEWIYRIGQRSQHVRRKLDPAAVAQEKKDRSAMLARHQGRKMKT